MKAEVRHHRRNDRAARELPAALHVRAADGKHLVAVDNAALLVDEQAAVRVAIERDADVIAARDDFRARSSRCVEPQWSLMFTPSGSRWMKSQKQRKRPKSSGAVADDAPFEAIDQHAQAGQVSFDRAS